MGRKVFPEAAPDVAVARRWDAIASLRRLDHPDPPAAWRDAPRQDRSRAARVPNLQSGLLFYSTLFDENAASHLAVGSAYKSTLSGGEEMSDEDFERARGNRSVRHVDFMIGSRELDVDGRQPTEQPSRSGGQENG